MKRNQLSCRTCATYDTEAHRLYTMARALEDETMDEETAEVYRSYVEKWRECAIQKALHIEMEHGK